MRRFALKTAGGLGGPAGFWRGSRAALLWGGKALDFSSFREIKLISARNVRHFYFDHT